MGEEHNTSVIIGGEEYNLFLSTRATKEITARYGDIGKFGEKINLSDDFCKAVDEIIWLITLLANQSVMIHNLKNKDNPKPLLKEDDVELLTSPSDYFDYHSAIYNAMHKGTKRNVESEPDSKNTEVG